MLQAPIPTARWLIRAFQPKRNVMDTLTVEVARTKKAARESPVGWISSDALTAPDALTQLSSAITKMIAVIIQTKPLAVSDDDSV